ncbi:MAG: hypothetical protein HC875_03610 [Anaerolineales bacterium]|nr:hypothetical protein [Anaerolineales bacterium]
MQTRARRPYEKKLISKGGAVIFGLGLGALLATAALGVALAMPTLSPHLDNLVYRARSYYRKLMPHPEYLPTPSRQPWRPNSPQLCRCQRSQPSRPQRPPPQPYPPPPRWRSV